MRLKNLTETDRFQNYFSTKFSPRQVFGLFNTNFSPQSPDTLKWSSETSRALGQMGRGGGLQKRWRLPPSSYSPSSCCNFASPLLLQLQIRPLLQISPILQTFPGQSCKTAHSDWAQFWRVNCHLKSRLQNEEMSCYGNQKFELHWKLCFQIWINFCQRWQKNLPSKPQNLCRYHHIS